ncbi:cytochrome P450 [Annulohypoxylon truncatum]|uniref:cytochrome P450 n=1 Tax=Annulohypoxylon truncatum TaxID=327061 RepID=UPI002007E41B|nr:cytochrome P450 [Annulohypoxylon truncatum]KAI1204773.1 cytochrome P450 [Annulohypoxylon truncatum]
MIIFSESRLWFGIFLGAVVILTVRHALKHKVGSLLTSHQQFNHILFDLFRPLFGILYLIRGPQIIDNAYRKANGKPFKITTPSNDHLLIASPEMIREMIAAPLESLSLHAVAKEILQPRYTMYGFEWQNQRGVEGTGFVRALRSLLTAHLPAFQPEFERILRSNFSMELGKPDDDGFARVQLFPMIKRTVTNVNCFVFFGEELCKNERFTKAALEFPQAVIFAAELLRITPKFMRSSRPQQPNGTELRGRFSTTWNLLSRNGCKRAMRVTRQAIDCVQWLIDTSPRKMQWSPARMVGEIMAVWFGSVHQLAMTTTYAIEDLCIHDDCIEPLRAEITKARATCKELGGKALDVEKQLPLLDSFLRESIRCNNSDAVTGRRKALMPYIFSDGTSTLAVGDWVCVPQRALMHDATRYRSPDVFDAFRFLRANQQLERGEISCRDVPGDTPSSLTTASIDWPIWGFGNTACPGRFYASMVAKLVMVHVLEDWTCRMEAPEAARSRTWRSSVVPRSDTIVAFKRWRQLA